MEKCSGWRDLIASCVKEYILTTNENCLCDYSGVRVFFVLNVTYEKSLITPHLGGKGQIYLSENSGTFFYIYIKKKTKCTIITIRQEVSIQNLVDGTNRVKFLTAQKSKNLKHKFFFPTLTIFFLSCTEGVMQGPSPITCLSCRLL